MLALHKQLPETTTTPHEKTALASGLIKATCPPPVAVVPFRVAVCLELPPKGLLEAKLHEAIRRARRQTDERGIEDR